MGKPELLQFFKFGVNKTDYYDHYKMSVDFSFLICLAKLRAAKFMS